MFPNPNQPFKQQGCSSHPTFILDGGRQPLKFALFPQGEEQPPQLFESSVELLLPTLMGQIEAELRSGSWRGIWLSGPGSFTGLRLSAVFIEALVQLQGIETRALSHLEAAASCLPWDGPVEINSLMRLGQSRVALGRYLRQSSTRLELLPSPEGAWQRLSLDELRKAQQEPKALPQAWVGLDWSKHAETEPLGPLLEWPMLWIKEQNQAWFEGVLRYASGFEKSPKDFRPNYELQGRDWLTSASSEVAL